MAALRPAQLVRGTSVEDGELSPSMMRGERGQQQMRDSRFEHSRKRPLHPDFPGPDSSRPRHSYDVRGDDRGRIPQGPLHPRGGPSQQRQQGRNANDMRAPNRQGRREDGPSQQRDMGRGCDNMRPSWDRSPVDRQGRDGRGSSEQQRGRDMERGSMERRIENRGDMRPSWDRGPQDRPGLSAQQRCTQQRQPDVRDSGREAEQQRRNSEWRGGIENGTRPRQSWPNLQNSSAGPATDVRREQSTERRVDHGSNMPPSWDRSPPDNTRKGSHVSSGRQQQDRRREHSVERRDPNHMRPPWHRSDSNASQGSQILSGGRPQQQSGHPHCQQQTSQQQGSNGERRFDAHQRNSWDSASARSPSDLSRASSTPRSDSGTQRDYQGPSQRFANRGEVPRLSADQKHGNDPKRSQQQSWQQTPGQDRYQAERYQDRPGRSGLDQSRTLLPRQWNGPSPNTSGPRDAPPQARMESSPPEPRSMERVRHSEDRSSAGGVFRGSPERQRPRESGQFQQQDAGISQDRRNSAARAGNGEWRGNSNLVRNDHRDRSSSWQRPSDTVFSGGRFVPHGGASSTSRIGKSRNASGSNDGPYTESNTRNAADASSRGKTLIQGDEKAITPDLPIWKKWSPPNKGNVIPRAPLENRENNALMSQVKANTGDQSKGIAMNHVDTHEVNRAKAVNGEAMTELPVPSANIQDTGRVPVVMEMKLPRALEVRQNLLKDIVKDTFTPELTEASTETDLRASASYSSCSVPHVVQSVDVSESPHSLTHPEDEVVERQTRVKESMSASCVGIDAGTKESPSCVTENDIKDTALITHDQFAWGAAESDSGSSDSSDDETDEEELRMWAQKMFGIAPQQPEHRIAMPKPRREDEAFGEAEDVDSSDDESELEEKETSPKPRLHFKLSVTIKPTNSSVQKKAPAPRKKKGKTTKKSKAASRSKKAEADQKLEAEDAKRKKDLAKPLTAADIQRILAEETDCCAPTSTHWVRRSVRQPSRSALNHPNVRSLMDKLRVNDYDMTVLKMKKYLSDPDTPQMIIDAALDAMEENTNCQALYIQNFNEGMRDEQVLHLLKILQMPTCNIWCVNIGETYNVKTKTWKLFAKGLKTTKITHMYASEHTISGSLKEQIRETIRKNRSKHDMHINPDNLDVIVQCTHCWWNPINAKVLRPYLKKRGLSHILEDKEAQGLPGSSSMAPAGDAGEGESTA